MDQYGALPLPVPAPGGGAPDFDPALTYLLAFLKAALTSYLGAAFGELAPGFPMGVVGATYAHDPETRFIDRPLPALYVWRQSAEAKQIGAELRQRSSIVKVDWVFPPDTQEKQRLREPMINAVDAVIDGLIGAHGLNTRDPSWRVAGDTDPNASAGGSRLAAFAKYDRLSKTGKAQQSPLRIAAGGREGPLVYQRIECLLEMRETWAQGLSPLWVSFDGGVDVTAKANPDLLVAHVNLKDDRNA